MSIGTITTGDHCRIAWEADGPEGAPVVILSNSLGTARTMWEPQVPTLAGRWRVIRYDTRGHGKSDAPEGAYSIDRLGRDVLELADALDIATFSFCGLSLGGMVGQWLGWRVPERIDRLVIANSSPFMGPPSGWDARIDVVRRQGMAAMADPVLERWFTPAFRADPANISAAREMLLATSPTGYAGCCAAIRDMDMRPTLSLIRAPTLIIGGSADPVTPPEHNRLLSDGIQGAACVMLEAAHLSNREQPGAFNAAVIAHLAAAPM